MDSEYLTDSIEFQETAYKEDSFSLLIYDIAEDKRRLKLAQYLEGYGVRVQKSAFEIRIDKRRFEEMLRGIPGFVTENDSVKLYKIRGNREVYCWGNAKPEISEEIIIL